MIYIFVVAPAPSVQRRTLPPAVDTLRVQRYADSGSRFIIFGAPQLSIKSVHKVYLFYVPSSSDHR